MDLQIDHFYQDASRALLILYRVFPRKAPLYVDELIGFQELDQYGLPTPRHQSCLGTLLWLGEEGYLRHDGLLQYEAIDQAVLTEKGFLRLTTRIADHALEAAGLPPDQLRIRCTLARQLHDAIEQGDDEQLARLARLLFVPSQSGRSDTV